MGTAHRLAGLGVALASMAMAPDAWATAESGCAPDAEAAAVSFMRLAWSDPAASAALIAPRSLALYRGRLEQLLEDRYSPMSASLRTRVLGEHWTPERLHAASDRELIGAYLAHGGRARTATLSAEPVVKSHVEQPSLGDVVTVAYEGTVDGEARTLEYPLVANAVQGCWMLDMPMQSWPNLDRLASVLRKARTDALPGRAGPSRARLEVVAAYDEKKPGRVARPDPRTGATAWVASPALAREADIVGAAASWDCEAEHGPAAAAVVFRLSDDAGHRMADWSAVHIGDQLAIVVDGEVLSRATVQSPLGSVLSICLPDDGHGLDRADKLARALRGVR